MVKALQVSQSLLADVRKRRGWTQAYVAEQIGVSVETVRQWENGRHFPYQVSIQKLCMLFHMKPEELGLFRGQPSLRLVCAGEVLASGSLKETPGEDEIQQTQEVGTAERQMAWKICLELVTRIPIVRLDDNEGLLREALTSLHEQFRLMRTALRSYGSSLVQTDQDTSASLCLVIMSMLNKTIRPLLAKWHPLLKDYEDMRPPSMGTRTYEQQWERAAELRQEIVSLRMPLLGYATSLAQIAGTPWLVEDYLDTDYINFLLER